MRTNIYYWKCDNSLSAKEKQGYNDKYALADITPLVRHIATDYFGEVPQTVESAGGQGNHYTYVIHYADKDIFFRSDDGKGDDDYMAAESEIMRRVAVKHIPVPKIYYCDATCRRYPLRFQLMEKIDARPLCEYHQKHQLDQETIGRALGRHLAGLHQIKFDGFGFINTAVLRQSGQVGGLDASLRSFFHKRLSDHLQFIDDHRFLSKAEIAEIKFLFHKHDSLLNISQGCLVHKDMALWNVLGTPDRIQAIIDWDDVIIGDPVDDLAILKCFYEDDLFRPVLEGYREISPLPDNFYAKLWLYLLRNMLWKIVVRITMNYFEMDEKFFINQSNNSVSLKEFTYHRVLSAIENLIKGDK